MEFGERLKEVRISLNCSQKELAEKTGLTLRTIQRIENNEVKPSLYSLKVIGETLKTDFAEFAKQAETKPYEFNLTIKITDMNQLFSDIKTLVKNHWKILLWIVVIIYAVSHYTEIKTGMVDGWNAKGEEKK
jgi:transcriptional regulator with XRE-family HTH domain